MGHVDREKANVVDERLWNSQDEDDDDDGGNQKNPNQEDGICVFSFLHVYFFWLFFFEIDFSLQSYLI
jgi:hypothetical protein